MAKTPVGRPTAYRQVAHLKCLWHLPLLAKALLKPLSRSSQPGESVLPLFERYRAALSRCHPRDDRAHRVKLEMSIDAGGQTLQVAMTQGNPSASLRSCLDQVAAEIEAGPGERSLAFTLLFLP